MSWKRKVDDRRAEQPLRTRARVTSMVGLGEDAAQISAAVRIEVLQGMARDIAVSVSQGVVVNQVNGATVADWDVNDGAVRVRFLDPIVSGLERSHGGGSVEFETGFVAVRDVQRERGEVAIEGAGTMELTAAERDGVHRLDVRELSRALQTLARLPVLAAFRYQRTTATPALALAVKRFADVGVLAAVADRAVATTLVTSEGRALTEIALDVQNRAQPFLKLTLPAGATIVSAEVAGQTAKPVAGTDGIRVPLLRPGFRPTGPYRVSFVYLHASVPFARRGDLRMTLPKMDVPVGFVEWELFVPEQYSARAVDGNVISAQRAFLGHRSASFEGRGGGVAGGIYTPPRGSVVVTLTSEGLRGQVRVRVTDESGAVIPGATVTISSARGSPQTHTTGPEGTFVASGISAGQVTIIAGLVGFGTRSASFPSDGQPHRVDIVLSPATRGNRNRCR